MIGGWLQTGRRADRAVHIGGQTAAPADDVMVVISHPRLVASRMAGRLDASDEADILKNVQIVVHGLCGERAETRAGSVCNGFHVPMPALALHRHEYGEAGRRHPQTGPAKGVGNCRFVRRHCCHYRFSIWNESTVRRIQFLIAIGIRSCVVQPWRTMKKDSGAMEISLEVARRFILGKQGLWPGRRWRGAPGAEEAMRAMEYLQLDPLQIVARSQDIKLYGRVLDYSPGMWEEAAYQQRKFFDWGGWLAVRPMEELPHWRVVMRRERDTSLRLQALARDHAEAIEEMRANLRERGVVNNREFAMATRKRTDSYRGRKDSALALYYLWYTGEVMTHHRDRFERVYALTEAVAPAHLIRESGDAEADRFLIRKEIAFSGLSRLNRSADSYRRGDPTGIGTRLCQEMLEGGAIVEVKVEGWKQAHYALGSDVETLFELSAGRIPHAWKPLDTTTVEEVVFLAPLDNVSARGRAKILFGFDYVWEVYKPESLRKFGYYTLPVLWGDRLVARFDSKLDRKTNTLVILGLWLEEEALGKDAAFAEALARGFARFVTFLGADKLDSTAVGEPLLRERLCGG